MKTIYLMIIAGIMVLQAIGQDAGKELKTLNVKTSAQCGMCKEAIEKALAFEKGVKSSVLDLESKVVTVKYVGAKTSPEKIRKAISAVGYDADDVEANARAYSKLPACCRKPGDPLYKPH
jgi:periplasmic mercuric ion binding protein